LGIWVLGARGRGLAGMGKAMEGLKGNRGGRVVRQEIQHVGLRNDIKHKMCHLNIILINYV
jgi:hypothetical protein